jgi:hypothetical protein
MGLDVNNERKTYILEEKAIPVEFLPISDG